MLTAAVDPRVAALCLLDPVDNTIWAPLGPGYPSGIQALKTLGSKQVHRHVRQIAHTLLAQRAERSSLTDDQHISVVGCAVMLGKVLPND